MIKEDYKNLDKQLNDAMSDEGVNTLLTRQLLDAVLALNPDNTAISMARVYDLHDTMRSLAFVNFDFDYDSQNHEQVMRDLALDLASAILTEDGQNGL